MKLDQFYDKAYNWVLTAGPKIVLAIVLAVIGLWLIRILKKWLSRHLLTKKVDSSIRPFLVNLSITAMQILLIFACMQVMGVQMTIFAAVIGAFGVAAGLALSGTLQNFTSGILILLLRPFRVGDNIIAQGQEGTVTAIQIFFTTVKTFDNKTVILPNSKLSNEVIVNLSREGNRRIDIEMKFSFGIDYNQVKDIISRSIEASAGLLNDPAHRIGISTLESDGYKVQTSVWAPAHGFNDSRLKLQEKILNDLKGAGIKLPGV